MSQSGPLPPRVVGFHEQVELLSPAPMLMTTMLLAAHGLSPILVVRAH
jgi:hypothetical protein